MFWLYRYKKNGLASGLVKIHEFLLEDIIQYFEKGKSIKKRVKEARKTVKKAIRFGKKKKVYPNDKTDRALELMEELQQELNYTHQVINESAAELDNLILQIKEERVASVYALISSAREHFRKNELEQGNRLLKEAQKQLGKKLLLQTRKDFLTGIDSKIKKLKREIEKRQGEQR